MAELSGEHLIEVRVGTGKPPTVRVRPGETIGPMSVGAEGAWRVEAAGVGREHAEIYFDGKQLFVRSLSAVMPVLLGGRPVPNAWTPLTPPCELMLGEARIWFGPDIVGPKMTQMEELLEDDDNVETSVAEPPVRPWSGDLSALVQRGIENSRSQPLEVRSPAPADPVTQEGARLPPLPEPPRPPAPFWPAQGQPEAASNGGFIEGSPENEGPSKTRRTDNSAQTRIEPVEQVVKRSAVDHPNVLGMPGSLRTSGNYPQAAPPSPWGAPPDQRPTLHDAGGLGGTAILPNSPLPAFTASSPPSGGFPVPTFGPPPSASPSAPPSFSGLPVPGAGPPMLAPTTGPSFGIRLEQPASIPGLERNELTAKKSAWREMSGPRKGLILLSPLLVLAVLVIFMGEELGIGPPRGRGASAKPSATPSATAPSAQAKQPPPPDPMATTPPTPSMSTAPMASTAISAVEPPPSSSPSVAGRQPPTPQPPNPPPGDKSASARSLQRRAADAVAQGAYATAAELYEQLATQFPNKPAYAEAAAIMRAKASGSP